MFHTANFLAPRLSCSVFFSPRKLLRAEVVGNDGDPNVLLRNNGHGGFGPPVDLPGGPDAYTRALALAPLSPAAMSKVRW